MRNTIIPLRDLLRPLADDREHDRRVQLLGHLQDRLGHPDLAVQLRLRQHGLQLLRRHRSHGNERQHLGRSRSWRTLPTATCTSSRTRPASMPGMTRWFRPAGWTSMASRGSSGQPRGHRGGRIGRDGLAGGAVCDRTGEPGRQRRQRRLVVGAGQADGAGGDRRGVGVWAARSGSRPGPTMSGSRCCPLPMSMAASPARRTRGTSETGPPT